MGTVPCCVSSTYARGKGDTMTIKITQEQARLFLINRQQYRAFGSSFQGQNGVAEVIRHLGAVQIDPINVFERNHHHVLFSRVAGFRPEMLDEELYGKKQFFEYFCNALCVLPMEQYPYFAYRMQQVRREHGPSPEIKAASEKVLQRLRAEGAMASKDFDSGEKVRGWWDPEGGRTKAEKAALDNLHYTGDVMISSREGMHRRYDLPERVVPLEFLEQHVTEAEYRSFMLEKFLLSYGLSQTGLFRFGWFDAPKADKKQLLGQLVGQGKVAEVQVEGVKRRYYCHQQLSAELLEPKPLPDSELAVFLAPLDNLIWDRDRLLDFFGIDYRWEVYTPEAKRKYGYYVLPVLFGQDMVGRIELKAIREKGQLAVVNRWLDVDTLPIRSAISETITDIAAYLGLVPTAT